MNLWTSNIILSSESPPLQGDYSTDKWQSYEEELHINTFPNIVEFIEPHTVYVYCTDKFPTNIVLELDLEKIEKQELIYNLNKVL